MSPVSPGEATPSPLLASLRRSDHHDGPTPHRGRRSADRKAELKGESQPAEYTKSHSPRPESTPDIKVVDTFLYRSSRVLRTIELALFMEEEGRGD